ncbi:MAG: ABC transporter ATP-binding protein [Candidatus Thorarchaeota archaeon]
MSQSEYILELNEIKKYFLVEKSSIERIMGSKGEAVHAVDGINLKIKQNEIFGLCGESGCGKTTTARVIGGLDLETAGEFIWEGYKVSTPERKSKKFKKNIQFIFQNPFQSLHPRMKVGQQLSHAMVVQKVPTNPKRVYIARKNYIGTVIDIIFLALSFILFILSTSTQIVSIPLTNYILAIPGRYFFSLFVICFFIVIIFYIFYIYWPKRGFIDIEVLEIFNAVGLNPPMDYYNKFPHQLSGGERQRVSIARALMLNPKLIIADEPTSMLDVSIRASILDLIGALKDQFSLSVLFITHDLATVRYFCDKVAIMYVGEIVETGLIKEVFDSPRHPYTWALLQAIPVPDPNYHRKSELPSGEVPDAINPPSGCRFHPRCQFAKDICKTETPKLEKVTPEHSVACHFQEEIFSQGNLQIKK